MDPNSYQSTYDSLAGQYQPQTDLINSQIADLPRQQQAVTDSLNQAKVNAFKDITNSANAKGVLFSGVPIDQQATYTGTKYLPALAQNQTAFQNTKNTLLGQINSLQSARQRQAQDSVSAYQRAQQDNAYKQAQLDLGYARLNSSNANSAASRSLRGSGGSGGSSKATAPSPGSAQRADGGFNFTNASGGAISARLYAQLTGTSFNTVLKAMAAAGDKGAADVLKNGGSSKAYKALTWN